MNTAKTHGFTRLMKLVAVGDDAGVERFVAKYTTKTDTCNCSVTSDVVPVEATLNAQLVEVAFPTALAPNLDVNLDVDMVSVVSSADEVGRSDHGAGDHGDGSGGDLGNDSQETFLECPCDAGCLRCEGPPRGAV